MPRGRHRHSQPLHKLLAPTTVAATSVVCAAGSWVVGETLVIRSLAVAAGAAAVVGAFLMRHWDRGAGKRVTELTTALTREEWKTDDRIAELENDAEEAREMRAALDTKLRAKRAELARLRTEHADLLRRYATAETERASALEGRRKLAQEATDPAAKTLAGASPGPKGRTGAPPLKPADYRKADAALRDLVRNAARQDIKRTIEVARRREAAERLVQDGPDGGGERGKHAATGARTAAKGADVVREHHTVPAAAAVVPQHPAARRAASRAQGGFDFFGTGAGPASGTGVASGTGAGAPKAIAAAPTAGKPDDGERGGDRGGDLGGELAGADLADVVGDEAVAEQELRKGDSGEVIDLTVHDETEQIDVAELRTAIS
ncbi:hypothetical protein AB0I22_10805 [Streptomyces sp. NPDC050610]|uniref:coiled-coil domain-containing protein n=1 Tax=Streptomyces sp. NPDC050610 TaxID=3157097 RepID=UPI00341DAAFB